MLKANTGAGSSMLAPPGQRSSMVNVPDNKAFTPNKANERNNKQRSFTNEVKASGIGSRALGQSSSSSKLVMTGSQFVDPN